MARTFKIHETVRDDAFGVIKKQVKVYGLPTFETPTKCLKDLRHGFPSSISINEVTKRIYPKTIQSIYNGTADGPRKVVCKRFLRNRLNLTIFELMYDSVPSEEEIRTFASYWYAASESALFLPTVKMSMLKEDRRFSDKKMSRYLEMMRQIIDLTEAIGNTKVFIGTIPLIPPRYSTPIVKLYLDKGITAFAIDAGTKDFLNHEADFRSILMQINDQVNLSSAFIYACNLGIPRFVQRKTRADDFLSLFAYVDAFGSTFKTKGGVAMTRAVAHAKEFLREELAYRVSTYQEYFERTGMKMWNARRFLNNLNQHEQLREADRVRALTGRERMQAYLEEKNAVDDFALKHLGSIAEKVRAD